MQALPSATPVLRIDPLNLELVPVTPTTTLALLATVTETAPKKTPENRSLERGLPLVARVNGEPVFLETLKTEIEAFERALKFQGVDFSSQDQQEILDEVQIQVLQSLLDQQIIEQQAEKLGLSVNEIEMEEKTREAIAQAATREQFEIWLADNNLSYGQFVEKLESELITKSVFERMTQSVPEGAEQIRVQYIRAAGQEDAETIIDQLKQGVDFTVLVEQQIAAGNRAAFLNWFPRQASGLPDEVKEIAFSLQPGEISGPIYTSDGLYIIKLEGKEANYPLTKDEVQELKNQIFINWLQEQHASTVIEKFVALK